MAWKPLLLMEAVKPAEPAHNSNVTSSETERTDETLQIFGTNSEISLEQRRLEGKRPPRESDTSTDVLSIEVAIEFGCAPVFEASGKCTGSETAKGAVIGVTTVFVVEGL